jgi:hypothetical protein
MGLPRDGALIVSQRLLDQRAPDLYERFLQLAEKYPSVRDEHPDATIPGVPQPSDPESHGSGG